MGPECKQDIVKATVFAVTLLTNKTREHLPGLIVSCPIQDTPFWLRRRGLRFCFLCFEKARQRPLCGLFLCWLLCLHAFQQLSLPETDCGPRQQATQATYFLLHTPGGWTDLFQEACTQRTKRTKHIVQQNLQNTGYLYRDWRRRTLWNGWLTLAPRKVPWETCDTWHRQTRELSLVELHAHVVCMTAPVAGIAYDLPKRLYCCRCI